ncbi:hypothetical protein ACQ4PT_014473 [Festuca glaucescens]
MVDMVEVIKIEQEDGTAVAGAQEERGAEKLGSHEEQITSGKVKKTRRKQSVSDQQWKRACVDCTKTCARVHGRAASSSSDKAPPATPPSFFKVMMGHFSENMEIPPPFAKTISDLGGSNVYLEDAFGLRWRVRLCCSLDNGRLSFGHGWKNFVLDHAVAVCEFLVFRHIAKSVFAVQTFAKGVSRNRESIDDARWGSGNRNNEEGFLMRNGSATTEAWTGLVNNDINHVWNHGRKFEGGFHCRYCNLRSRGGGATRFKEHLGHVIGDVKECPNVPRNIRDAMKGARNETRQKKREKATHHSQLGPTPIPTANEKKDQFRKWMVSDNWKECIWKDDPDYVFAEELLSSNMWWAALEWVLRMLEPLYKALRYADTQKKCTLSRFKKSMMSAVQDIGSHFGAGSAMFHRVMSKVSKRIDAMQKDTLMVAAAVLDPYTHYQINMSNIPEFAAALTDAIEKIADPDSAVLAIHEISNYRECRGRFGQRIRAEEDQDPVRENAKEKEVDPCAMMMDTTMFDESNPVLEWLNEDGEHTILDGSEAASAVFEKICSLNSSRKENHLGRKDNSRKRTRAVEEEEEDAYNDCEDDEEEENEYIDVDDGSDDEDGEDDSASEADGEVSGQGEKDGANQVINVIEGTSDNLGNRRSGRVRQAKKVKDVNSLYY